MNAGTDAAAGGGDYTLEHFLARTSVSGLALNFRDTEKFLVYCKQCPRYNSCWACPPYDFNPDDCLMSCNTAYLIGTKITINKEVVKNYQGREKSTQKGYELIRAVRKELDAALLNLETRYTGSRAFFAGTCHICPDGQCGRISGKPCIAPGRLRPSLEAFGFDIGRISAELLGIEIKWSDGGALPEYFTLVSGFFTAETDTDIQREIRAALR